MFTKIAQEPSEVTPILAQALPDQPPSLVRQDSYLVEVFRRTQRAVSSWLPRQSSASTEMAHKHRAGHWLQVRIDSRMGSYWHWARVADTVDQRVVRLDVDFSSDRSLEVDAVREAARLRRSHRSLALESEQRAVHRAVAKMQPGRDGREWTLVPFEDDGLLGENSLACFSAGFSRACPGRRQVTRRRLTSFMRSRQSQLRALCAPLAEAAELPVFVMMRFLVLAHLQRVRIEVYQVPSNAHAAEWNGAIAGGMLRSALGSPAADAHEDAAPNVLGCIARYCRNGLRLVFATPNEHGGPLIRLVRYRSRDGHCDLLVLQ